MACALPDETKYPEMSNLVKKVQTHHHATTCRKKKGAACSLIRSEKIDETVVKYSKKRIDKVLSYIITVSDLSDVTLSEILKECRVTEEQYNNALGFAEKRSLYYINGNYVK